MWTFSLHDDKVVLVMLGGVEGYMTSSGPQLVKSERLCVCVALSFHEETGSTL